MGTVESEQLDFSIVSPELTVKAMRDSGYKDTDHAIAELIDNSIDAGANLIELIAVETPPSDNRRYARDQVSEIAVVDNGEGMDESTLRRALRFGDGTRLEPLRRGIGRFGIGLPNASVSQCRRVEVWTWRNGADNSLYSYLDLEEIERGAKDVPKPTHKPVPDRWRTLAASTSESSGTLVLWSQLDRVRWKGGQKTLDRTAELCGRIYRKFLADDYNPIKITLITAADDGKNLIQVGEPKTCLPNDPLYLMTPSATPLPFGDRPMFRLFAERIWTISNGEQNSDIHVRCTMAQPDAINEKKSTIDWPKSYPRAGDAPWGKHADRNKGVSIVRARRELEISQAWVNSYEPEERWWSVEVEFDPMLDEVFGVVNNKQHAHIFVSGARFNWEEHAEADETLGEFRERLRDTGDPRARLEDVWTWIDDQISRMRVERKHIMKGTGTERSRHPETGEEAEDVATNVVNEQVEQGVTGTSDEAPSVTEDEKIEQIAESAKLKHVDDSTAMKWAEETVLGDRRFLMKEVALGHDHAFFEIESVNNVIEVWLNEAHPVYEHLIEVVTDDTTDQTLPELTDRLEKASFTLRMLLFAWSRYEDKAPIGVKGRLKDFRMDWGREARDFFNPIES